jgi:hypothetical protein
MSREKWIPRKIYQGVMNKEVKDGPGFGFVINVLKVYIGSNSAKTSSE